MLLFFFNQVECPISVILSFEPVQPRSTMKWRYRLLKSLFPISTEAEHKNIQEEIQYLFLWSMFLFLLKYSISLGSPEFLGQCPRVFLSNQCVSYLLTAVGAFLFKFKMAKNNFLQDNREFALFERRISNFSVWFWWKNQSKEILIHTENMFGSATLQQNDASSYWGWNWLPSFSLK